MSKVKPRPYQNEALQRIEESWQAKIQRQLVVKATGLGKTVTAAMIHNHVKPGEKTLFIVDRIVLADQAVARFLEYNPSTSVGVEMAERTANLDDDVVVMSVDSFGRKGSERINKFPPDHFGKIICDEAHVAVTTKYQRVLSYFGASPDNMHPDVLLVGITATTNRQDGVSLGKLFDDRTCNYDLVWAINQGWLTDIEFVPVKTGTDISDVETYKNGKSKGEFKEEPLTARVNTNHRNELIIKAYDEHGDDKRCIVFAASVEHAYELERIFQYYGYNARAVSAQTSKSERKKIMESYYNDETKILVNYGIFNVGFDDTELGSIIMARPFKSEMLYQQTAGRAPRPSKLAMVDMWSNSNERLRAINRSPKPVAKIIDLMDNTGSHNICSFPKLFGLSSNFEPPKQKKFYSEVVEPLKQKQIEHNIDVSELKSLDDVDLIVRKRQRVSLSSVVTPKDVAKYSKHDWSQIGRDTYELSFPNDGYALVIEPNTADRYDLKQVELATGNQTKLNKTGFGSMDGAMNVADRYADQHFDTTFHKTKRWMKKGLTDKQLGQIKKLYKEAIEHGDIIIDERQFYTDTQQPYVWFINDRGEYELLNRGGGSKMLNEKFAKLKNKKHKKAEVQ